MPSTGAEFRQYMGCVWQLARRKNLCLWVIRAIMISGWAQPITFFYVRGISFMAFEDKDLVCKDCGATFIFTIGEQEFYAEKGFENEPQRCRECRTYAKQTVIPKREELAKCLL